MRAFEFLIEYNTKGRVKGTRNHKYRDGGKPPWYEKAVKLKTDNPRMSASDIGRQLGVSFNFVLRWLTGVSDNEGRIRNDNPPFTIKDFPLSMGGKKYFDGAKPWWYKEAIKLRKQGMMYKDIANKLSTPEESISKYTIRGWLLKGKKRQSGNLINPDAPFEPRPMAKKIDTALIKELIDAGKDDAHIIKYIQDKKGDKIAGEVRGLLPKLRQKLNPGTQVIDKTKSGLDQDPESSRFIQ